MARKPVSLTSQISLGSIVVLYGLHCFTSLAYQVVWMNLLATELGRTRTAMGLVMAVFTAGLGFGAAGWAWKAQRRVLSPRTGFALAQGALGLYGAAFPWLLQGVDHLYLAFAPATESGLHHGLRLAVSGLLLLPPSCLIGAIFPLLSGAVIPGQQDSAGRGVGYLCWGGLLCGGLGALAVPFWFMPCLGFIGTSIALGLLNGMSAMGSSLVRMSASPAPLSVKVSLPPQRIISMGALYALSATRGCCLLGLENLAAGYLWLVIETTVYAEGILLGTVLGVMAVGAIAYVRWRRAGRSPFLLLLGGWLCMTCTQTLWLWLAADMAHLSEGLLHQTTWVRASGLRFFIAQGVLALIVLGGPALAAGGLFPALCELASNQHSRHADPVGRLTAWHYAGAVFGAVGTPCLVPVLGMTGSLVCLSVMPLVAAGGLGFVTARTRSHQVVWSGLCSVAALLLVWLGTSVDLTFRTAAAGTQQQVVFHHEDSSGVVEVYVDRQNGYRTLRTNRLLQEGGDSPDERHVTRLQGALPVLLHPAPHRVLVVGLGTGISLAASIRPEVERLTCVEIAPGVVQAAQFFAHAHDQVLQHPKLTLVQQDGRNFLKLTRESYDLIVQDLFFPYRAGVSSLYTYEHYLRLRNRLAPAGRAAQWIALNQVGPLELRTLVRTFMEVFPHTSLWLTGGYLLLYGGSQPITVDSATFAQRFAAAVPVDQTDAADVLGMFVSASAPVRQWARVAPLHTDSNAWLEYRTPWAFAALNSVALAVENLAALLPLQQPVTEIVLTRSTPERQHLARVSEAARWLREGIVARARGDLAHARELYEQAYALNPVNYQVRSFLAQDLAARGRQALLASALPEAETLLRRALALHTRHPDAYFDLALVHVKRREYAMAIRYFQHLLHEHPAFPHVRFNLGVSLYHLARYAEAVEQFAHIVAREPTAVEASFNLANSLAQTGQYGAAIQWYQRTLTLAPDHGLARSNLQALQAWDASQP